MDREVSTVWPSLSIGSMLSAIIDYRGKTPPKAPNGIPCLSAASVKNGKIDVSGETYVTQETYERWTTRGFPRLGDVLITTEAPVGEVASFPGDRIYLMTRRIMALRGKDGVLDNNFLKYALLCPIYKNRLLAVRRGTTAPRVLKTDITGLEIPVPPFAAQRAIAHILGTLDDKIELNRRMNATLEAMARALFQSWFVDFDPVRAKMDGRKPAGMNTETAALFPDAFVESEFGLIPKGWSVAKVQDVIDGLYDGPHATPPEASEGAIFLGIKNLTGTGLNLDEIRFIGEDEWARWTKRITPKANDIVFSYEATLGFFALIPPNVRCCLGRRLALLRLPERNGYPYFFFHQFVGPVFQRFLKQHSVQGATVDRVPLLQFPAYPVLRPITQIIDCFEIFAENQWSQIHAYNEQSRTLATLRDTILPKLLSGELSVKHAEKLVGEAT